MNKEMIISVNAYEKRVAILEDGVVVEFYVERADESKAVVGNIYKGKVRKVLPGMQSAFVDIGLERDAFLYVGDFFEETEEDLDLVESGTRSRSERSERPERQPEPPRRDVESRRFTRERPSETTPERPMPSEIGNEEAKSEQPQVETALPTLEKIGDAPSGEATSTAGDVLPTPLLSSLLGAGVASKFERISDDVEESEPTSPLMVPAPTGEQATPPPTDIGVGATAGRAVDESLEVERETLADSLEADAQRERRRGRRKEIIGEEKKKPSRRRSKKIEEEVAALVAAAEPPPASGTQLERVRDEDLDEEAGDLLKDALIQQKIIVQTRIEEIATNPDVPSTEPAATAVPAAEPPLAPLTLGYERIADDDVPPVAAQEAPPTGFIPPEATVSSPDAASLTEEPPSSSGVPQSSATEEAGEETSEANAQLQVRPRPAEFPARRGRRSRRRGGRSGTASSDNGSELEDRSDVPEDNGLEEPASSAPLTIKSMVAAENGDGGSPAETAAVRDLSGGTASPMPDEGSTATDLPGARTAARTARDEPRKDDRRDLDLPRRQPAITELLREGQEIIVQIAKEPIGLKGARITSYVSLPGRYLVYLPTISHIGVSRKISTEQERARLKRTMTMLREREGIPGGFIVRTACEGRSEQDLCDDMLYLARTWRDIRRRAEQSRAGTVLCRELDLVQRLLRDHMSSDFSVIRVDDPGEYASIVEFINRFQPKLVDRVRLYTRNRPIFEEYNIQPEIEAALKPRVWLKSGGFIVINQTEALVAIDVNTGKFVGKSNRLEDTITRTNIEAAAEIVRQIRLRDLGGIIVLDFIDMEDRRNRQKVMQVLEQAMKADRSPSKITSFNDFGLVAITRKRVRQSLERILSEPCHYCGGSGMIKSAQTMCYEILSDAKHLAKERAASGQTFSEVTLRVSPPVADLLRGSESRVLREIEFSFGTPVTLHSDPNIHQERFDFAFL